MIRRIATAVSVAVAAAFSQGAAAQAPAVKSIKMQSSWPASITLQEHFTMFAGRVEKLTAGSIKIDALAAGQIVLARYSWAEAARATLTAIEAGAAEVP